MYALQASAARRQYPKS